MNNWNYAATVGRRDGRASNRTCLARTGAGLHQFQDFLHLAIYRRLGAREEGNVKACTNATTAVFGAFNTYFEREPRPQISICQITTDVGDLESRQEATVILLLNQGNGRGKDADPEIDFANGFGLDWRAAATVVPALKASSPGKLLS